MERAEAIRLLSELINTDLVPLAKKHSVNIYVNNKKNKGWAGHTIERYLQLPLNSSREPDFGDWELKSALLYKDSKNQIRVKGTISITMLNLNEIVHKTFEESHVFSKLNSMLIVARLRENAADSKSILHSIAEFDMQNDALHAALKKDYDLIREAVINGQQLSSSMGKYIQTRTKGAGHGSTSRGFYARTSLVAHILNIAPIKFDEQIVSS